MTQPLRIFMIAGELSGDKLGADLLAGLNAERMVEVSGVGGPLMQDAGLNSLFDMSDLSVMGLVEVLPKIPKLLRRVQQTAKAAIAMKPDVIITIDSPDFCLRVVSKIKEALPDVPVVHYVAPSVWAWRPERAEKMARSVDHVLALLPFEPPYMQAAGMSCDFVGHPAVREPKLTQAQLAAFRSSHKIEANRGPVLTLLPGSRRGEIKRIAPLFRDVMAAVRGRHETAQFIVPIAAGMEQLVRASLHSSGPEPIWVSAQNAAPAHIEMTKRAAYASSDAALATSGTVALELAAADCPMVVTYRANWATTRMVKKLAQIDTANLINIVTDTRVIPEFMFENSTSTNVEKAVLDLLSNSERKAEQRAAFATTMAALGNVKISAANSVLTFLDGRQ